MGGGMPRLRGGGADRSAGRGPAALVEREGPCPSRPDPASRRAFHHRPAEARGAGYRRVRRRLRVRINRVIVAGCVDSLPLKPITRGVRRGECRDSIDTFIKFRKASADDVKPVKMVKIERREG